MKFVVNCVHLFTKKFRISCPEIQHSGKNLPFEVLLHDGASAHNVLFSSNSARPPIANLLESNLKLGLDSTLRMHCFFTHSMLNCRCISPLHLQSNWISALRPLLSPEQLHALMKDLWPFIMGSDICD